MEKSGKKTGAIDDFIATYPPKVQTILKKLRRVIKACAPRAEETIAYGIPTFKLNGNLVHFAGFKNHIGFFPTPSAIVHFKKDLKGYKLSKGTIQFPLDEPIPFDLVKKIVKFRVKENLTKKTK